MQKSANPLILSVCASALFMLAACSAGGNGSNSGSTGVNANPDPFAGVSLFPGTGTPPAPPPPTTTPPPVTPPTTTPPVTAPVSAVFQSPNDAVRFMLRSSFGSSMSSASSMVGMDAADWVQDQMSLPATPYLNLADDVAQTGNGLLNDTPFNRSEINKGIVYSAMFNADDELRQRMMFALSQIWVVNFDAEVQVVRPYLEGHYLEILSRNAFGNFRDLMQEITFSPGMGRYLTYIANRQEDPATGRMPDENYARELLQLFTIGLFELNMDGTQRQGPNGPIPTYSNSDIEGLARVFTGLAYDDTRFRSFSNDGALNSSPMVVFEDQHEDGEKSFLGNTIPAGTSGVDSVNMALDMIFEHPNVAPFIARQLIQRFTASSPSPEYVERVARAFERGLYISSNDTQFGTGQRGDLAATLAAVLLDDTNFIPLEDRTERNGKIREPLLRFIHWGRAFNVQNANPFQVMDVILNTTSTTESLGQQMMRADSVFNFYRPGFVSPGSEAADAGLTTPEFQLSNAGATVGYVNFMTQRISRNADNADFLIPDYSDEVLLADDVEALIDHLNMLLTGETMTDDEIDRVRAIALAVPIEAATEQRDRLTRVQTTVTAICVLPSFIIQR